MTVNQRFFSLRKAVRSLKPSATLLINEKSKALEKEGKQIFRLGFGQSPFPVPEEVIEALKVNAFQKDYLPVKGLPELREAVANHQNRKLGISCKANDVMIGPGSKEFIFFTQFSFKGDLLLPSPSWVSYEPQAHLSKKIVTWLETTEENGWRLLPDKLEAACKTNPHHSKLLILNYPNNPTGTTYSVSQLEALAKVARKYAILVLADEIYGEIHHDGKHASLAKYYPEGTIISSGLSKWCGAGGWRLGTFTFPESYHWLLEGMAVMASETFSAVSAPIQHASVTAFNGSPLIDDYLNKSRGILKTIGNHVWSRLSEIHISMPKPEGGFYLFPNFEYYRERFLQNGIRNSEDFCEDLLMKTGVALLPGTAFGRPPEEFSTRLSYVDFDGQIALDYLNNGLGPDENYILKCCPKIQEAMVRIADYLS